MNDMENIFEKLIAPEMIMDYKSPIEVMVGEMVMQYENDILKAVQDVGIDVDKEELLKALLYDRGQYEKGYADGVNVSKWIPISRGNLPDIYTQVLCCNDSGEVMVGRISWDEDSEDFVAWGSIGAYNDWMPQVVAWMPIVPYKVEG